MDAFTLREQEWDELLSTEQGQDWMFPVLAHLFDDEGNSLTGTSKEELPSVLDKAAQLICKLSLLGMFEVLANIVVAQLLINDFPGQGLQPVRGAVVKRPMTF